MKWFRKLEALPEAQKQFVLHNGRDMNRFYTLKTEERQEVLNRISLSQSPDGLEKATERD